MGLLHFENTFTQELPGDVKEENTRRQVFNACFSSISPRKPSDPSLIHVSDDMAMALGLTSRDTESQEFIDIFSGTAVPSGSQPYAMCYGGHQFGSWAGQLGDGRAINLGDVVNDNNRWTLQLKGAGETPYSRSADGLAVLRSSIREHLCSEAMYHLGVPTTRSLSLMLTGDEVLRDIMYDGNAAYEKGAVVCRVAPTFIRFGNFQIFAARRDFETLRKLTDYTIRHFYSDIDPDEDDKYIQFFQKVADRTLDMIIHWQRVGFVHGVMNTDNMSILGQTIDYGPYGWLEGYDHNWTPNTTDRAHRRYRFGNQPNISLWNLAQLGSALVPLISGPEPLMKILEHYKSSYTEAYQSMMASKIGIEKRKEGDQELLKRLEEILQLSETDMTIFFRELSRVTSHCKNPVEVIDSAFYNEEEVKGTTLERWEMWMKDYQKRLEDVDNEKRKKIMNSVNPKYVLRNYMAQMAIDLAEKGDYSLIDELYQLLKSPYDEQSSMERWYAKRPEWARDKVGCSMLSCSS